MNVVPSAMNDYLAPDWQRIFEFNGLRSFDDFWKLEAKWFEEPNQRRGGWSGVARCELKLPDGGITRVFLKRQENHMTRTLAHPFRGELTFLREFRCIERYQQCGIPSLTPLYFAWRRVKGDNRAVLMTAELEGFRSLEDLARDWSPSPPLPEIRRAVIHAVARLLAQIHSHQLRHNCFYPKHVFVRLGQDGNVEARVIDLEKTKARPFGWDRDYRDLRTLNRHSYGWSLADRVRFFCAYLGQTKLQAHGKEKWRRIARRHFQKHPHGAAVVNHHTVQGN